jgi:hypothetical protein
VRLTDDVGRSAMLIPVNCRIRSKLSLQETHYIKLFAVSRRDDKQRENNWRQNVEHSINQSIYSFCPVGLIEDLTDAYTGENLSNATV